MQIESLTKLKAAFEEWRSERGHVREATPAALLGRARQAVRSHGLAAVARATKVDRRRLRAGQRSGHAAQPIGARAPAFSRVQVAAPAVVAQPFAEVETASGLKLRLFTQTDGAVALLSSLCGAGGAR